MNKAILASYLDKNLRFINYINSFKVEFIQLVTAGTYGMTNLTNQLMKATFQQRLTQNKVKPLEHKLKQCYV